MAVSKEDILETISNMSVMEVVDLISAMEEKFGVSAAAAVAAAPAAAATQRPRKAEAKGCFTADLKCPQRPNRYVRLPGCEHDDDQPARP